MSKKIFHMKIKRIFCGALAVGMLLGQTSSVLAEAVSSPTPTPNPHTEYYAQAADTDSIEGWPTGPQIEAQSAVLMDLNSEAILYSKNADTQLYPASITKLLTCLLGCENLDTSAQITLSQQAAYGIEAGSSTIYGDAGEVFTVEQALMGLMLESANEMALAIGEEVSGSVKKFVELMNARAQQLGCTNTHFNNPNGLPDETHVTTANDMAKIAKAAWQNATCRKFFTTDLYEIPPTNVFTETRYLLNHHKMMAGRDYAYDGVLGGKTGYTDAAGATLVTYAKRGNMLLVAVVMNSVNGAWSDTKSLLDYGFDNFERQRIKVSMNPVPKENLPSEQYLLNNCGNTYPFYYTKNIYVTVPIGTDVKTLTRKQRVLSNAVGPLRLKSKYYFNVIADETANPVFAAADLLSQAEHGFDSQVFFILFNYFSFLTMPFLLAGTV